MRPGPLRGPAFEAFIAPARGGRGLWRLVLGLGVSGLVWILASVLAVALGSRLLGPIGNAATTLAVLCSFAGLTLGVVLAAWLFDGRGLATLIGPGGIRPRAFAGGALIGAAFVALAILGPALATGAAAERRLALAEWLGLLPIALVAVLIQTSAEEIFFRAYLTQGLAARVRTPIIWLGLPAVLFGALHWSPASFGPNAPLVALCAALIGVILGDVTARTGNLSRALGLHFANNIGALLIIAPPAPLGGLALYAPLVGSGDVSADRSALLLELTLLSAGYGLWLHWNRRQTHPRDVGRRDTGSRDIGRRDGRD